ncbi:DUF6356 family protein [Sneathiella chinensis]|uniref:Capsule biosynthesis protein n=1 Tax=Sneathiella chinensis TaxID=349750 RepID=A0ABQ5U6X3_9PROT|nr:DUF6356 family protein [Sneathiella chinensis]GLQ07438.1 hypothetical protein GCM10007924_26590 [Sneathiella chinensis]
MSLKALFTEHPNTVNETYVEHMRMSSGFGGWLFLATLCAFLHAVFPFLFEKTASGIIARLYGRMVTSRVVRKAPTTEDKTGAHLALDSACL